MKKTVLTPWCHENSAVPVTHAELDSVVSMHRLIRRDRPSKHCVFIKEVTKIPVSFCFAARSFLLKIIGGGFEDYSPAYKNKE